MKHSIKIFLMGFSCFIISQVVLRLPILSFIYSTYTYSIFHLQYSAITTGLIALSAGIFEEGGRYIFRKYTVKSNNKLSEPIIFGLGHGLSEVLFIFMPYLSSLSLISYLGIKVKKYFVVIKEAKYEDGKLVYTITFDEDYKLGGIYYK